MSGNDEATLRFWHWFQAHSADFEALCDPDAPFWDEALGQLQRLDSRLRFEVSHPDGSNHEREFVITAEGHADAFPIVETIVAHAPEIPGWQFIALKPPMGFDFTTTYEGIRFLPSAMWFQPLASSSYPQDLGLKIGVPNFTPAIERQARNAVAIILDTALGERLASLGIQHLEVARLPESPECEGFIELHKLLNFLEDRPSKRGCDKLVGDQR